MHMDLLVRDILCEYMKMCTHFGTTRYSLLIVIRYVAMYARMNKLLCKAKHWGNSYQIFSHMI